jgi:hypothetical protein
MLVWAAVADLLVFSVLISSSQSILFSAGYCCRWFCGGVRRGPMDNGKDQLPSSLFLVSIGAAADHFFWKQAMTAG